MTGFPASRPRRLRLNENMRRLVRETSLSADNLIAPMFVRHGKGVSKPIASMPGHLAVVGRWRRRARPSAHGRRLGIPAVLLFGIPAARTRSAARTSTPRASCLRRPSAPSRPYCRS